VIGSDAIVIQRGGLGGAYMSIDATDFVGSALSTGGDMAIGGQLMVGSIQGGSAQLSNATINLLNAPQACLGNLQATAASIAALTSPNASLGTVSVSGDMQLGGTANLANAVVQTNLTVGGASMFGNLTVNNLQVCNIATIETGLIVNGNLAVPNGTATIRGFPIVTSGNAASFGFAPLNSPAFTGRPTAPTPSLSPVDNSNAVATTAFVLGAMSATFAPIDSPNFTGMPSAPTAPPGTSTGQLATCAFVQAAIVAATTGVSSFNTRTGAVVLSATDLTAAGGALLASPLFTGNPRSVTPAAGDNSISIATTAFVMNELGGANVGVVSFNGRGGAVTFLQSDLVNAGGALAVNAGVTSFNGRTGAIAFGPNDLSAVNGATLASPAFTGQPTAPTAPITTNTTQLATTAFVTAAIAAGGGVATWNGRTGAVTLAQADILAAGGASAKMPTIATFVAPQSGTYTPSAGVVWIRVRMVAGGGGGSGGGGGNTAGQNTTFGGWTCIAGGAGQLANGGNGGQGGTGGNGGANGTGSLVVRLGGAIGGFGITFGGGTGQLVAGVAFTGTTPLGINGCGGTSGSTLVANNGNPGAGGSGEYVEFLVNAPVATAYSVGNGGVGVASGQYYGASSPGGPGLIVVEEHY
jgi:hypothetical protein